MKQQRHIRRYRTHIRLINPNINKRFKPKQKYRVWVHGRGDDTYKEFNTLIQAKAFSKKTKMAEPPILAKGGKEYLIRGLKPKPDVTKLWGLEDKQ